LLRGQIVFEQKEKDSAKNVLEEMAQKCRIKLLAGTNVFGKLKRLNINLKLNEGRPEA
jgi:hypothetical protein